MANRKYKRNKGATAGPQVRLSQCMIVKNEERNIEKALSWGKNIVCEQIVVDTGSTDRTVEIAEHMGAKVLHFEWINDFAAAKNFAIEQASGNWIAFLDADEYIEENEAGIVIPFLETIMNDAKMRKNYLAVCCPWIQLNDKGQPKEVLEQERIFQNRPGIRYVGKIHEKLSLEQKDIVATYDFRIMHTGYTEESFMTTGKASRNIELLREDLKSNPNDMTIKAYLAESLRAEAAVKEREAGDIEEAAQIEAMYAGEVNKLYTEVLESKADIPVLLKKGTYEYFLRAYTNTAAADPKIDDISRRAYKEFPSDPKFMCYYAMTLNKNGLYSEAFTVLKKCEEILSKAMGNSSVLTTKVMGLFAAQMVLCAQGLGDVDNMLRYAEIMLLMDKTNMGVLQPYIAVLTGRLTHLDDVLGILAHTYDMSSKRDLLIIAKAAKNCGAIELARRIVDVAAYLGDN